MLQSMGSQRIRHDSTAEQQQSEQSVCTVPNTIRIYTEGKNQG